MSAAGATPTGPLVVISGAAGFLGSAFCRHLLAAGYRVRGLVRNPAAAPADLVDVEWHRCELPDEIPAAAFAGGVSALIHCAYETRFVDAAKARAVNVGGSRRLFEAARAGGVERILLISSMSAHAEACSLYGLTKLEAEALLDPARDAAIRPGHVIGEGGVFWRTAHMIRALPFIPLFFGGRQQIQTVALADVCRAVEVMLAERITGIVKFAEAEPITLREFYGEVAIRLGKTPRFIPFPGSLALAGMRALEAVGFPAPLSSDNLLGLKRLRAFDVSGDLERLGIRPTVMRESLAGIRWEML